MPEDPLPLEKMVEPMPVPPVNWWKWGGIALVVIMAILVSVFAPRYKKTVHDLEQTRDQLSKTQSDLVAYKKSHLDEVDYYPNGKKKREVHKGTEEGIHDMLQTYSFTVDELKKHDEELTKRGGGLGLEVGSTFTSASILPRAYVGVSVDVITVPLLNLPIRAGLNYQP